MQARRARHATLRDHAVARADAVVAGRAEHVVLLAATRQEFGRHRRLALLLVGAREIAARHRAGDRRLQHAAVAEQAARLVLVIFRLRIHVGARAAGPRSADNKQGQPPDHAATISTELGLSPFRKFVVLCASNCASLASTQRKKRSFEARANCGAANTGWFNRGSPFSANMPMAGASAANKI